MRLRNWLIPLVCVMALGCAQVPQVPQTPPNPFSTAQAGDTTVIMPNPEAKKCCKTSIWDFLGIGQIFGALGGIGTRIRARLGSRFPGLEPKPPIKTITDPANLSPDAPPAVQGAAEVKAEEDAAPQKIKAIRYLGKIGCGDCYPDIEDQLLAALDDCTESVRYEAAKAFRFASGNPCDCCKDGSCCSEKAIKKLDKVANGMKDNGCYEEPSPRVRRMARLALRGCGGGTTSSSTPEAQPPEEGPTPAEVPPPAEPAEAPAPAGQTPPAGDAPAGGQAAPPAGQTWNGPGADDVVARVNGKPILRKEVMPQVLRRMAMLQKVTGRRGGADFQATIFRMELDERIGNALILHEAQRQLANQVAHASFDQPVHAGSGLLSVQSSDQELINEWLEKHIRIDREVTDEQLRDYYQSNLEQYQRPAAVRWERVTVPQSRFPTREHGQAVISYLRGRAMGLELDPPQFELRDIESRVFDWTEPGAVVSEQMAQELFSLQPGRVSAVWEDSRGWHLFRVLERRAAHTVTFEEARHNIRQEILRVRRRAAERGYRDRLRDKGTVWTVYQAAKPAAAAVRPAAAATGGSRLAAPAAAGSRPAAPAAVQPTISTPRPAPRDASRRLYRLPAPTVRRAAGPQPGRLTLVR